MSEPRFTEDDLDVLAGFADQHAFASHGVNRSLLKRFIAAKYVEDLDDPRVGAGYYNVTAAGKARLLKLGNPGRRKSSKKRKNKEEPTPRSWDIHYKKAFFQGRHVLTIEAGTPQEAFRRGQMLAQRGAQGLAGLIEHPRSAFQISPAKQQAQANPRARIKHLLR
jgi:hypothetical protein